MRALTAAIIRRLKTWWHSYVHLGRGHITNNVCLIDLHIHVGSAFYNRMTLTLDLWTSGSMHGEILPRNICETTFGVDNSTRFPFKARRTQTHTNIHIDTHRQTRRYRRHRSPYLRIGAAGGGRANYIVYIAHAHHQWACLHPPSANAEPERERVYLSYTASANQTW